ncbi:MAG TPA: PfkB family carbohydrate kinase [Acidobacteriaceae bacterium]|nr:PfkB family carbohydrate kinase [Acidobacteriaceae bacterium]
MSSKKTICGLGELLWDLLPSGGRMGGAPANFTVMAARLGNRGVIASRLGADQRGAGALAELKQFPVDLSYLQTDPQQPTGTVGVEILEGEPHYVIHKPVAWDFMEWTSQWRALAEEVDAVCFGSLAQREPASRDTIQQFVGATRPDCLRVFDVNLRAPFFSARLIAESLQLATIFKLNEGEVPIVLRLLGGPSMAGAEQTEAALRSASRWLLERYPLKMVAITMGAHGSLLVTHNEHDRHMGLKTSVADTVGAGDAFTAALVDAYLRGVSLYKMNDAGNLWGSWVASRPGAMPELDDAARAALPHAHEPRL